jgi:5-(carboxyamino)imidazole ribonucleotide mutase
MCYKVGIITGSEGDSAVIVESIKILNEYDIAFETNIVNKHNIRESLPSLADELYKNGVRVVIAGTKGDANFSNIIASYFNIPTVGIPLRNDEHSPNNLESIFSVLQQPNEHAVANVAFDSGQNAGILAVQILALNNQALQNKVIVLKENLKNKILKANQELTQVKFKYKTN